MCRRVPKDISPLLLKSLLTNSLLSGWLWFIPGCDRSFAWLLHGIFLTNITILAVLCSEHLEDKGCALFISASSSSRTATWDDKLSINIYCLIYRRKIEEEKRQRNTNIVIAPWEYSYWRLPRSLPFYWGLLLYLMLVRVLKTSQSPCRSPEIQIPWNTLTQAMLTLSIVVYAFLSLGLLGQVVSTTLRLKNPTRPHISIQGVRSPTEHPPFPVISHHGLLCTYFTRVKFILLIALPFCSLLFSSISSPSFPLTSLPVGL